VTVDGPVAVCDRHDFPGLIDEGVPGIAAVIDDVVSKDLKIRFDSQF
jgi:hypothetical protein